MTSTKTFIRGAVQSEERFFILAQESRGFDSQILNYYTVRRGKRICFTSSQGGGEPLYFTGKVSGGLLDLYVGGNLKTPESLKLHLSRNVDKNHLYAGVWYKITKRTADPVPWSFIQGGKPLIGNRDFGYFTSLEGAVTTLKDVSYCIIPEFFQDEKGKRYLTFEILRKKILERNTLRGFTLSHEGRTWFEYPRLHEPQYLTHKVIGGSPKRGYEKVVKPHSDRIGTFSDLQSEGVINPRKEEVTDIPSTSPKESEFWYGLICGILIMCVLIVVYLLIKFFVF